MEEPKTETPVEKILTTKAAVWGQNLMKSRSGMVLLVFISFLESLLPLPIVTDPFLLAAVMANRKRTVYLVLLTTASSVVGGFFAYLIVVLFKDSLLGLLSPELFSTLQSFVAGQDQSVFVLTIVGADTPVPYTITAWAIALGEGSLFVFILASVVGRGFRYGVVGWCTYRFGPLALSYAKRSILFTSITIFILAALYAWLKM